jgi:hypothetical protein
MQWLNPFQDMSREAKGALLMIAGLVLLLNTAGIFAQLLKLLVVVGSIYIFLYGLYLSGYYKYITTMVSKK